MFEYHREKLHVYHFWKLKGKLIQKGYNKKNWNQQQTVELKIYISIKLIAKTVLWSYFVIGTGHHTSLVVNLQHWTLTIFWACVFISRNFSMHSFLTSKIFDNLVYKKKYLSQINIHKHWHLWKLTYIIVSVKVWLAYVFHWIMKNIPQGWETWLENHQECHLKKNDIKILCSTSINFHEKCVSTSLS